MSGWNEITWFSFFIGVAFKSTVALGAAWLLALLMRKQSAAARHLLWTAGAASVLALPLLSIALPALRVQGAAAFLALPEPVTTFQTTVTASSSLATEAGVSRSPIGASEPSARVKAPRADWKLWLMQLWAAGAAAALAQMLVACAAVWRIRRKARPFRDGELGLCGALSQALGIHRRVDVLETEAGSMPMTFGVLRSAIFMPSDAAGWSEERRRIVLLHELAHVRRGDVATHLLARTALTVYWWNPLAWKAWREFLKEGERATDDMVLNSGAGATDYAGHLLAVARAMQCPQDTGWATVAMARRSQLESRLAAILDSGIRRKAPGRRSALIAALAAMALMAPLAAVHAQNSAAQDSQAKAPVPADVDSAIRAADSQKNYQILEDAAKAAEQQRKFDTAQQLLEPAVAIRGEVAGQHSVAYGIGLLKLGDLESKRHLDTSALDFYTRGAQILGDRPEAAPALIYLGINAIKQKNYSQAFDYFQHAQNVDPAKAGTALMWMAVTRQHDKDPDQATTLFQRAVSVANPASSEAVTVMKVYASFLKTQGRKDESTEMDDRANAAQKALLAQAKAKVTAAPGAYKIAPGMTPPKPLQSPAPEYSEEARIAKLQGTVSLSLEIGPDGLPRNVQVLQGIGLGMDEKAVEAVRQWIFQPGTKDGQAVTVAASIEVNFRLL
jgi:TonB family protein